MTNKKRTTIKDLEESHRQDMILVLDDIKLINEKLNHLLLELDKHWNVMKTIRKDTSYCLKKIRKLPNYKNLEPYRY